MAIVYFLCWLPYAIEALFVTFDAKDKLATGMTVFAMLAAKSSICFNPLIYVYMNREVREAKWEWED